MSFDAVASLALGVCNEPDLKLCAGSNGCWSAQSGERSGLVEGGGLGCNNWGDID